MDGIFGAVNYHSRTFRQHPREQSSSTVLRKYEIKSHVRREFSIGGVKIYDNEPEINLLSITFPGDGPGALIRFLTDLIWRTSQVIREYYNKCPGMPLPEEIRKRVLTEDDASTLDNWLELFGTLTSWKNDGHIAKTYRPGLVAGQAILARLITYTGKSKKKTIRQPKPFAWNPKMKRLALRLRYTWSDVDIALHIGCPVEQVKMLWLETR
jgi:hypothetical protein